MRASVGPYQIVDLIGRGGMGVVYLAEDPRLGRRVAIKTLGAVQDREAHDRLWREARAAAGLNHPGICQVFDVGEEKDGGLWVAMELLEGESLEERLERERPTAEEAVQIARGILSPLGFLHRRGFVHRDLKPSNVFLTPHGVKLLDFGLARPIADDDAALTRTGAVVGSPRYMAPEQWRGGEVGPRADLFACGAILFEMLTGRRAFPGESAIEVFRAVALDEMPSLAEHAAGDPTLEALDPVVARALAGDPAERYESATELATALGEALASASDGARAPGAARAAPGRGVPARRRGPPPDEPLERFIALPFRLLRPDPEIEFLSSSLPEAIGSSLAPIEHLVVRSTRLVAGRAGEGADLRRVAAEAEVDLVLEGTLMRAGDRVRLAARLVRVPAGTVEWSVTEQAPLGDLFELQDDLTRRVVESLSVPLSARDRERLRHDIPATARAYELYLRALHVGVSTVTASAAHAARDLYRSCLDEDPELAPAWARYARTCRVIAKYGLGEPEEHRRLAADAFRRAFELDPDSPLAHNLYTYFQLEEEGDSVGAMERLLARLSERPADADLFAGLCAATRFCGLYRASVAAHERARRIDPSIKTSVEHTYLLIGEYELAAEFDTEPAHMVRRIVPALRGDEASSIAAFEEAEVAAYEGIEARYARAVLAALGGRREECEEASRIVYRGELRDPEAVFYLALPLARAGAVDAALDLLQRMVAGSYFCAPTLREHPWLDPLRGEDRFRAVLSRAEEGRAAAIERFRAAGGERLLGVREG